MTEAPIPHNELVLVTARLCLRVLANPIADGTEKALMTKNIIESCKLSPAEVLEAMKLEIKSKATRGSIKEHYQGA